MNLLHWAVKRNFLEIAQYLLKIGINKNSSDINGKTPLHIAAQNNFLDMTKLLLDHKVNMDKKDFKGFLAIDLGSEWIQDIIKKEKRIQIINRMTQGGKVKSVKRKIGEGFRESFVKQQQQ